ncbi:hypothetical protein LINPERHAP1_LOCUS14205 [Linum perenne]
MRHTVKEQGNSSVIITLVGIAPCACRVGWTCRLCILIPKEMSLPKIFAGDDQELHLSAGRSSIELKARRSGQGLLHRLLTGWVGGARLDFYVDK